MRKIAAMDCARRTTIWRRRSIRLTGVESRTICFLYSLCLFMYCPLYLHKNKINCFAYTANYIGSNIQKCCWHFYLEKNYSLVG